MGSFSDERYRMLDIKFIVGNPGSVRTALINRRADPALLNNLLAEHEVVKGMEQRLQELEQRRNVLSRQKVATPEARQIRIDIAALKELLAAAKQKRQRGLDEMPNIPHSSVPIGDENVVVRTWGEKPHFHCYLPHDHIAAGCKPCKLCQERGQLYDPRIMP